MVFWKKRVYADAAAATPISARAKKELVRLLPLFGNPGALHREALDAKKELEHARKIIAGALGAHEDEIVFTASGTEGNNLAVQGVLRHLLLAHGELHAITSAIEHQSVLGPLCALEREGLYLTELPVDHEGFVSPKELAEAINDDTVFVSIQLVNSEVGTIQPLREIAKEIRRVRQSRASHSEGKTWPSGPERPSERSTAVFPPLPPLPLYFHTDASQAPLWLDIDVEKLGIDLMTLDAQKVLGPKGAGALYVKRGVAIEALLWGGAQEGGLRGGTQNTPQAGAFAVALEDAQAGVHAHAEKISAVRNFLISEIKKSIPDAILNGPSISKGSPCYRVANNLNVSIPGLDAEMAVIAMDAGSVAVSTRSACSTGEEEMSHVLHALGVTPELANTVIRITLLPDATYSQARRIAAALSETASRYRRT